VNVLEKLLRIIQRNRSPVDELTPMPELVQRAESAAAEPEKVDPEELEDIQAEVAARLAIIRAEMAKEREKKNDRSTAA
jgi:hypothetical protein